MEFWVIFILNDQLFQVMNFQSQADTCQENMDSNANVSLQHAKAKLLANNLIEHICPRPRL